MYQQNMMNAMAEEVLQDVFLSLLSKLTKPSSAFALHNLDEKAIHIMWQEIA